MVCCGPHQTSTQDQQEVAGVALTTGSGDGKPKRTPQAVEDPRTEDEEREKGREVESGQTPVYMEDMDLTKRLPSCVC